jgi:dihydrofolate synthase/folylpolyglutamate synthase
MEKGLKVGLYTSPHYKDFRERIKINREYIKEPQVLEILNNVFELSNEIKPSFFEITVAMAFEHFAEQSVDVSVIETGMGGRLDSTNIVNPAISIITNISFDHEIFLGDTLGKIAQEKAGIIKKQKPIVIGEKHPDTSIIFQNRADEFEAPLIFAEDLVGIQLLHSDLISIRMEVNMGETDPFMVESDCSGEYQMNNIRTTIAAAQVLEHSELHMEFDIELIQKAISNVKGNTGFIGRNQLLQQEPVVLVDSAHNEAGIRSFWKSFAMDNYDDIYVIVGFVQGKNVKKLLSLFPAGLNYHFAKPNILRGMETSEVEPIAKEMGLKFRTFGSVGTAMEKAIGRAGKNDIVIAIGSCYLIAEVI